MLNTPGSLNTSGYDKIESVDSSDPATRWSSSRSRTRPTRTCSLADGGIIKKDAVANCEDISGELQDAIPFSGRPYKQESWSPDQTVLVPNDKYWVKDDIPKADASSWCPRPTATPRSTR